MEILNLFEEKGFDFGYPNFLENYFSLLARTNNPTEEIFNFLLKSNARMEMEKDPYRRAPLHTIFRMSKPPGNIIRLLIKNGYDINPIDYPHYLPNLIEELCEKTNPDFELIEYLIKNGLKLKEKKPRYRSVTQLDALQTICKNEQPCLKIIGLLLNNGFDVNSADYDWNSLKKNPFYYICKNENISLELIKYFSERISLKPFPWKAGDINPLNCLSTLVQNENCTLDIIKYWVQSQMIDKNELINSIREREDSPIYRLVEQNNPSIEIFEYLLECGFYMNTGDLTDNRLALNIFLSQDNPSLKFIKILLAKFQNKSRLRKLQNFTKNHKTPLHIYINRNHPSLEIIKLLIENGHDINAQTKTGNTPLHIYCMRGRPLLKVIELLIQNGADINLKNDQNETPIFLLVNKCNENTSKLIAFFIKSGAILTFLNNKRQTILHELLSHKNCTNEMLLPIINHFQEMSEKSELVVDFNQQDLNGDTILHLFCRYQIANIDTFHFLLKCGCNPTLSNKGGRTPMDLYLKKKFIRCL